MNFTGSSHSDASLTNNYSWSSSLGCSLLDTMTQDKDKRSIAESAGGSERSLIPVADYKVAGYKTRRDPTCRANERVLGSESWYRTPIRRTNRAGHRCLHLWSVPGYGKKARFRIATTGRPGERVITFN
ncbi:uncharacterized protein LOC143266044 [Megachile rotundata]|uniref:uncharacterized protein LOC143266044 n=1 Tax=Megachile rotundata TaxID=143995 RepID=UPI003FD2423C